MQILGSFSSKTRGLGIAEDAPIIEVVEHQYLCLNQQTEMSLARGSMNRVRFTDPIGTQGRAFIV